MRSAVRAQASLCLGIAMLAGCASRGVGGSGPGDLAAYDACAAEAGSTAPWPKAREEVVEFMREDVPLTVAVDALLITAQTAAGERPPIPTDALVDAISRHSWRSSSINPLQDWATRDERGPLLALRRCLANRYGYEFAVPPTP